MFKSTGKIGICLLAGLLSINVYADSEKESGKMIVQITNFTSKKCTLGEFQVVHGTAKSSPAGSLLPDQATRFAIQQSPLAGPDAFIRYNCGDAGDGSIRFEVQQDLVLLMGHEPTLTVHDRARLHADYLSTSSSTRTNTAGRLDINILPG
jgi:hypothetical protein